MVKQRWSVDGGRVLARAAARFARIVCVVCVTLAVLGLVVGAWSYDSPDELLIQDGPDNALMGMAVQHLLRHHHGMPRGAAMAAEFDVDGGVAVVLETRRTVTLWWPSRRSWSSVR